MTVQKVSIIFNDDQLRGFDNSLPDSDLNKLVDLNAVDISDGTQLVPDVTLKDMQTVLDVNIKDVTCNQCQDPMTHMIDELDIPFSTEMSVEMEKNKEKMAKCKCGCEFNTPFTDLWFTGLSKEHIDK